MKEDTIKLLERNILSQLPQIPFIIDQVGEALKLAEDRYTDSEYVLMLNRTVKVAEWVKTISDPNFYKTHLVLASIFMDIPNIMDMNEFSKFTSTSKALEEALANIVMDENTINERGYYNALSMHVASLAKKNEEHLCVFLYSILTNLEMVTCCLDDENKQPVTPQDYIKVLGISLVSANVYISNLSLLNYNSDVLNKIRIILNSKVIY